MVVKIGYFFRKIHEKCQEIGTKICNFEQNLCSDTFESKSVRCSFTHSFCQILVFPFLWVEAGCLRLPPSLPSPCLHLEGMEFTSTHPPGIPLLPFGGSLFLPINTVIALSPCVEGEKIYHALSMWGEGCSRLSILTVISLLKFHKYIGKNWDYCWQYRKIHTNSLLHFMLVIERARVTGLMRVKTARTTSVCTMFVISNGYSQLKTNRYLEFRAFRILCWELCPIMSIIIWII